MPTNLASYPEVLGSPTGLNAGHCDSGLSWFASTLLSTSRMEHYRTFFLQIPANSRGSASKSPASHRGGQGSILGVSVWDLWWTECHRNRLRYECLGFPLSLSFYGAPDSLIHHRRLDMISATDGTLIRHTLKEVLAPPLVTKT